MGYFHEFGPRLGWDEPRVHQLLINKNLKLNFLLLNKQELSYEFC